MPPLLELNCLVSGDDPSHVFTVELPVNKNVGALKDAVKEKKKVTFQHVDADALEIFKVTIDADERLGATLHGLQLKDDPKNGIRHLSHPVERLGAIFNDIKEPHIHVIVKRPYLRLLCYVKDDDPNDIFEVKIGKDQSVAALKRAIKEEKKVTFQGVDADALEIFKVSVDADERLGATLHGVQLKDDPENGVRHLSRPVERLGTIFNDLNERHIHVIVKRPYLRLFCYVKDDDPNHVFEVKIGKDQSIAALKDAIKEKKKVTFQGVAADALEIFKVSVDADEQLGATLHGLQLKDDPENGVRHLSLPVERLGTIFNDIKERHIHIIVKRPYLRLFCYVKDDDSNDIFEVKIGNDQSVAALKDAIKEKKKPDFDHIPADSLDIFKVSIDADERLGATLHVLQLKDDPKNGIRHLSLSNERLGTIFNDINERHIHVIVKLPPQPSYFLLSCYVKDEDPNDIFEVKIRQDQSVAALKRAIKEAIIQTFRDVDARSLILWQCSVAFDQNLKQNLKGLNLVETDQLLPTEKLSETFLDPPDPSHLHIIVKAPSGKCYRQPARFCC